MRMSLRSTLPLLGLVGLMGCGQDTGTSATPVSPTPVASPTPAPTPSPTPNPGNPFVSLTAKTLGYLRGDQAFNGIPADGYKVEDIIFLDCTPRDKNGQETKNHPLTGIEWYSMSSTFVVNVDYVWEEDNTFTPAIRLRGFVKGKKGTIDTLCRLGGVQSNVFSLNIIKG